MASRKSISKRKYYAYWTNEEGKWYTGYDGDISTCVEEDCQRGFKICTESSEHITQVLTLTPSHTVRGRSAANIVFKDEQGFEYLMSVKGVATFLKGVVEDEVLIENGYFAAEFCQVKQGSNFFIDFVED